MSLSNSMMVKNINNSQIRLGAGTKHSYITTICIDAGDGLIMMKKGYIHSRISTMTTKAMTGIIL